MAHFSVFFSIKLVFDVAWSFARLTTHRSPAFYQLNRCIITQDHQTVILKDNLLASGVILSLYHTHTTADFFLVVVDLDDCEIFFVGAHENERPGG